MTEPEEGPQTAIVFLDPKAAPIGIGDIAVDLPNGNTLSHTNMPVQDVRYYHLPSGEEFGVIVFATGRTT